MSSDGCSARQSMYSSNISPVTKSEPEVTCIGSPALVRNVESTWSRMASWSPSGIPSSKPMVRIGICAPSSAMRSKPPEPTSGSRLRAQNSRILPSSSFTRRAVKARDSRRRWMVWVGGSSKMRMPGGISIPALISSRIAPRPEM